MSQKISEQKGNKYPKEDEIQKEQLPTRPGKEWQMDSEPIYDDPSVTGWNRLQGKVAIITGGDSGIGRAVAVAYAKEGAKLVIVYKNEQKDADDTKALIEAAGAECLLLPGDIGTAAFAKEVAEKTVKQFGAIDILVNNAAEQHPQESLTDISDKQLEATFSTNIFGMFYLTKACLPHMKEGGSIINTTSITAYRGHEKLVDYASTKGAVTTFTRSLAMQLAEKGIRVNMVAPGPIWTPLIPSTFKGKDLENFGADTPLKRPGQPVELAESYLFLAWDYASSYITGQTIHVNGGSILNA